jgi:hypothetical protein
MAEVWTFQGTASPVLYALAPRRKQIEVIRLRSEALRVIWKLLQISR